jgi:hypothetical protein
MAETVQELRRLYAAANKRAASAARAAARAASAGQKSAIKAKQQARRIGERLQDAPGYHCLAFGDIVTCGGIRGMVVGLPRNDHSPDVPLCMVRWDGQGGYPYPQPEKGLRKVSKAAAALRAERGATP